MSGIFGLVNLDGAPVERAHIEAMRGAMAHWGPDGTSTLVDGAAGFGQCLLHNTPEALHERLPRRVGPGWLFTAEARIDNRDELCDLFQIPPAERPTTPDSQLMWLAYEKWGEESPEHLLGDWSFAVWRPEERRLFLARDHHGMTAVYYYSDATRFAFASDKRALLTVPGVPRTINEVHLAQVLLVWSAQRGHSTAYAAISRMPPAHCAAISAAGVQLDRFWRLEDAPGVRLASSDDYAQALLEHLRTAVACRVRRRATVGISLSGGLDSTSVAALASTALAGAGESLLGFTSVPAGPTENLPGRVSNEFLLVSQLAQQYENLKVNAVTASDLGPVAGLERMLSDVHGEPVHAAGQHYWIVAVSQMAQEHGVGVMLTAQHGNATISWHGAPSLASAFAAVRRGDGVGLARELRALAGRTLVQPVRHTWHSLTASRAPWQDYSFISGRAVARLRLVELMKDAGHDPTFGRSAVGRLGRLTLALPGAEYAGALRAQVGAAFGFEARDPTRDVRLAEFSVGLPETAWRGPLPRWLIRRAMQGLLPDAVRMGQLRGLQAADMVTRVIRDLPTVDRIIVEIAAAPGAAALLDLSRMSDFRRRLTFAQRPNLGDTHAFLRGLAVGIFLARAAAPQKTSKTLRHIDVS